MFQWKVEFTLESFSSLVSSLRLECHVIQTRLLCDHNQPSASNPHLLEDTWYGSVVTELVFLKLIPSKILFLSAFHLFNNFAWVMEWEITEQKKISISILLFVSISFSVCVVSQGELLICFYLTHQWNFLEDLFLMGSLILLILLTIISHNYSSFSFYILDHPFSIIKGDFENMTKLYPQSCNYVHASLIP